MASYSNNDKILVQKYKRKVAKLEYRINELQKEFENVQNRLKVYKDKT